MFIFPPSSCHRHRDGGVYNVTSVQAICNLVCRLRACRVSSSNTMSTVCTLLQWLFLSLFPVVRVVRHWSRNTKRKKKLIAIHVVQQHSSWSAYTMTKVIQQNKTIFYSCSRYVLKQNKPHKYIGFRFEYGTVKPERNHMSQLRAITGHTLRLFNQQDTKRVLYTRYCEI